MSTDLIAQGQALLDEAIVWSKTADPEYPFAAEVKGDKCKIRINDFPADNFYTLIVNGKELADFDDWPSHWTRSPATKRQNKLMVVAKPVGSYVTLYAIPEDVLEQFKLSPEKAAQLFPVHDDRSKEDASYVMWLPSYIADRRDDKSKKDAMFARAGSWEGDSQAYSNEDICYAWECDEDGNCFYVWWWC